MTDPLKDKVVETSPPILSPSTLLADAQQLQEERLFRHFRGWLFSERAKDTSSWTWDYGYDIQRAHERRWVCKLCIHQRVPQPKNFTHTGLQNASKHLFKEHHIRAPEGKTKSSTQLKAESVEKQHRSIADTLTLDPEKPREQAMANSFVKNFDRDHFQRMVMQWIVKSNLSFLTVEDEDLRAIFDYLSPSVALKIRPYLILLVVKYKQEWEDENRSKRTGQVRKSAKLPRICEEENKLTDSDWEALQYLEEILTHYENVVRTLEGDGQVRKRRRGFLGSYGNIWDVILGFEELLSKLEQYKLLAAGFPDAEQFRIGINLAWDKLEKYYSALDETPIYYAALALHPAYKWAYFEHTWDTHPEWVDKAREMVYRVWRTEYANSDILSQADESDDQRPAKRRKFFSPFEANSRHMPARYDSSDDEAVKGDEYETWQGSREASDRRVRDPITYWYERRLKYPRLSRMALDFLTIQPMSAECERLFSAAGRMAVPSRSLLDAQIISICQVSRSWYRAGIVKELDPMLISWREEEQIYEGLGMSDGELAEQATAWLRAQGDEGESEG
ncbi:hypothetical protein FOFC_08912 [Fusarium oxysporum]|nr:hypothetical protein FOFC_08912 [Fusarium oxysporum]